MLIASQIGGGILHACISSKRKYCPHHSNLFHFQHILYNKYMHMIPEYLHKWLAYDIHRFLGHTRRYLHESKTFKMLKQVRRYC